jgi:hypothetical protein
MPVAPVADFPRPALFPEIQWILGALSISSCHNAGLSIKLQRKSSGNFVF